jgi:2-isopropylmalate synthase
VIEHGIEDTGNGTAPQFLAEGHDTVGADARGEANLSVRHEGVEYDGTGTSKDIIEASALAWLDVANRLLRQRQANAGISTESPATATA